MAVFKSNIAQNAQSFKFRSDFKKTNFITNKKSLVGLFRVRRTDALVAVIIWFSGNLKKNESTCCLRFVPWLVGRMVPILSGRE